MTRPAAARPRRSPHGTGTAATAAAAWLLGAGVALSALVGGATPVAAQPGDAGKPPAAVATPGAGTAGAAAPTPEQQAEAMRTLQRAARNQLGVFGYCEGRGALGADTADLQRRMMALLPPPPAGLDGLDEAEATGRRGVVSFGGQQASLEDAARAQGTGVEALCRAMGDALRTQARAAGLVPPG